MSEAATTTTYNADLIDTLIDALNAGVTDVTFSRDVLETNRPEAWGVLRGIRGALHQVR